MVGFCRGGGSDVTSSKWEAQSIIVQYDGISLAVTVLCTTRTDQNFEASPLNHVHQHSVGL